MSIYRGDRPNFFKEAVDSLLLQTVPAAELIVAVDGPIGLDLEKSLQRIKDLPSVQIVRLATNQGPGASRHAAILKARHDIIAVMDADDISVPVRFERQLGKMQISAVLSKSLTKPLAIFAGSGRFLRSIKTLCALVGGATR
jgi:glycosyltransferase involved in cell wall biosynthesis